MTHQQASDRASLVRALLWLVLALILGVLALTIE
jgi:hypothetical protein